jgi:hypothetical protein
MVSMEKTVQQEQEGDSCLNCLANKHLSRAKDNLQDALNIANAKGEFTEVAEKKIQRAVFELNGAENDLDYAQILPELKTGTDELKAYIRKMRNFLRTDQSGLELATLANGEENSDKFTAMKSDLETSIKNIDNAIQITYNLVKQQLKTRANIIKRERELNGITAS